MTITISKEQIANLNTCKEGKSGDRIFFPKTKDKTITKRYEIMVVIAATL